MFVDKMSRKMKVRISNDHPNHDVDNLSGSPTKMRRMTNGVYGGDDENEDTASLVGISLTSEMGCHGNKEQDSTLGFILLDPSRTTVTEMRESMLKQVEALPASFRYLTKQGWPVTSAQETLIKVKHLIDEEGVVRIQPDYAKPRVGISMSSGKPLGFVFVSTLSLPISQLREAISAQLGGSHQLPPGDWVFVDRNFWPICSQQEEAMTIIDIVGGACVRLHFLCAAEDVDTPDAINNSMLSVESPISKRHSNSLRLVTEPMITHGSIPRSISPIPHGDSFLAKKSPRQQAKQILISYVRAEASQYALDVKMELEALKFSVYLDVHEIFSGSDWQDSLNYAVSNCEVFVPLVTPRYGETQWTNRELKLADILNKYIVPVSFVETWPPCCLAIQFATTQFINWRQGKHDREKIFRLMADKSGESEVSYSWDRSDVIAVSKDIGTRCLAHARKKTQEIEMDNKSPSLRSYPSLLPPGLPTSMTIVKESRSGAPMVVVSVHPKQKEYAVELKQMLESQGYEVWCTTELLERRPSSQICHLEEDATLLFDTEEFELDTCEDDVNNPIAVLQNKAAEAGVIIFVLSKAFADSDTCKQHVFYCEQRKRVVPLKFEEFEMPGWMSMLIGTNTFEDKRRADYKESLLARVKCSLSPLRQDSQAPEALDEGFISSCVSTVCKKLPANNCCVYISGGTSFFCDKSESICKEIGIALARLDNVTLVTGGFYGVGETVARSFFSERQRLGQVQDVWHILPVRDEQDRRPQGRQNEDKTFLPVPFGKTVFIGDSVRQREIIVSRVFDICILIEGGPGAAHEAEEFTWCDHTVIPIKCTGGAAGGKFNVPGKIFECPPGVVRDDWRQLANKNEPASVIGAAVAHIITALQQDVAAQMTRLKTFVDKSRHF